jgi:putative hydrolase of the HAD superfamily
MNFRKIEFIGIDADDTLWLDHIYFKNLRMKFNSICDEMEIQPQIVSDHLQRNRNEILGESGYINLLKDTGVSLGMDLYRLGKLEQYIEDFISHPLEKLPEVDNVLTAFNEFGYTLLLISKGNEDEQLRKIKKSCLCSYFQEIYIVENKNKYVYINILKENKIKHDSFIYIGNNMKDDIIPTLEIGSNAIWLNHPLNFKYNVKEKPDNIIEVSTWREILVLLSKETPQLDILNNKNTST